MVNITNNYIWNGYENYDVVLLTESRYINPIKLNPYIENVLKEDELVLNAFDKNVLKSTKKAGMTLTLIGRVQTVIFDRLGLFWPISKFWKLA